MRLNKNPKVSSKKQFLSDNQSSENAPFNQQFSSSGFDYKMIQGVLDNPNVTREFIEEIEVISKRIGAKPQDLLKAISFETGGTFSPSIQNGNGAIGLIQFLPDTAKSLGTTIDELREMTAVEQLKFVGKFFESFDKNFDSLQEIYKAIVLGVPKKSLSNNSEEWKTIYYYGGIRAVQQKLIDRNSVRINQRAGFVSGVWNEDTIAAIKNFQELNNLESTGYLDEETGLKLFENPSQQANE